MKELCEICEETISLGKCPICSRNVCRYCSLTLKCCGMFSFEFKKIGKKETPTILICRDCFKRIYSFWAKPDEKEKELLTEKFFELLVKLSIIGKI